MKKLFWAKKKPFQKAKEKITLKNQISNSVLYISYYNSSR